MLTRRNFVKALLLSLGLVSSGANGSVPLLGRFIARAEDGSDPSTSHPNLEEMPTEPLASFFLLSDLHITEGGTAMSDRLHWALQDITNWDRKLDGVILGGDLTDLGRLSDYLLLKKILNQYELPQIYGVMGNHDYYDIWLTPDGEFSTETMPNGKNDSMSRQRFQNFLAYGELPYVDAWIHDVHIIMLSQEAYVEEKPEVGEGAWYSDEQLQWLKEIMTYHEDGKPALIFIHQPLPSPGSDGRTHQLIRATEFRDILKPYNNVFVFSGHTHRSFINENHYHTENSFHWFNNASVGRTRSLSPEQLSDTSQGMYIEVYTNQVMVRGREFINRTWIDNASWTIPLQQQSLAAR